MKNIRTFSIAFFVLALTLLVPYFYSSGQSSACAILDSSTSLIPQGFGAAYNLFSAAKELLMEAYCADTSVAYPVGNGDQLMYIYNKGYYWTGTAWQQYTYTCSNLVSSAWCVGNATYTRSITSTQMAQLNYYLAYICQWNGTAWKCGCRDSACSTNYWNLQEFKK